MNTYKSIFLYLFMCGMISAQSIPSLRVSEDDHYIVTQDNEPFFWLGGTAWELIHRLDRKEVDRYLSDRAAKGFTVIQTVILAELDGLAVPNAYGHLPLVDEDPTRINEAYFRHVDYVLNKAADLGLFVGLLPTWGDKFNLEWGKGPEIFTAENARTYGETLAKRYADYPSVIWILGGDRNPKEEAHWDIINAMADGIRSVDKHHLMSYHPQGGRTASDFFQEAWLDLDMFQSGHDRNAKDFSYVQKSRAAETDRPVINGEARYENIPDRFWEEEFHGWLDAADVRVAAYWSMLAGAAGYTYGCNDIWQMYDMSQEPQVYARTGWMSALSLPGATQMSYLKMILTRFPWQGMEMKQSWLMGDNPLDEGHIVCAVGKDRDFLLAYTPMGRPIELNLSEMAADRYHAYWFNPRSGKVKFIEKVDTEASSRFDLWTNGWGSDFLLVLTAEASDYDLSDLLDGE